MGTLLRKVVKAPANPGSVATLPISPSVAFCSACRPSAPRSCTCSLRPPTLPMPLTGGGGKAAIKAPVIVDSVRIASARMASADWALPARFSNSPRIGNSTPALLESLNPLKMSTPANMGTLITPGIFSSASDAWRISTDVRSSDAPSGSLTATTK